MFERIINNRISKIVNILDAQAGWQKGKATADHLLILNTIIKIVCALIQQRTKRKRMEHSKTYKQPQKEPNMGSHTRTIKKTA